MAQQWVGNFDCAGECGRWRLLGSEFSKAMLARRQRDADAPLRCKGCVEKGAAAVRAAAAARQAESARASEVAGGVVHDKHVCGECGDALPAPAFSPNQLSRQRKGLKARCAKCVAACESRAGAQVAARQE